jgi:hypothetical protein
MSVLDMEKGRLGHPQAPMHVTLPGFDHQYLTQFKHLLRG